MKINKAHDNDNDIKPFEIYEHIEDTKKICSIYISNEIGSPGEYVPLLHKIRTIDSDTGVLLYLAGDGGDCDGMLTIINALQDCNGAVCAVVHGNVRSAHSCIALSAGSLVLYPHTVLMLHDFSGEFAGKAHELNSRLESGMKQSRELDQQYVMPFLTEKEFKQMLAGKDFWLHANDAATKARVSRHNKSRKEK